MQHAHHKARVATLATRHSLQPGEVRRMMQVLEIWPAEDVEQGLTEELADILADRELAQLRPLTLDDVAEIQEIVKERWPGEYE